MRFFKIGARSAAVGIIAALVVTSFAIASALYFDNLHSTNQAWRMMSDGTRLQMSRSGLADVKTFVAQYHGATTGRRHSDPCVETDCLVVTGVPDNDFWERHSKLSNWRDNLIRRRWSYSVLTWVDGKLIAQQQWFSYATPTHTVMVITETSKPSEKLCANDSYRLHHCTTPLRRILPRRAKCRRNFVKRFARFSECHVPE